MTDYYTPQNNGIGGLEEFGGEFVLEEVKREQPVSIGGVKLVGPCYRSEAVAEFLRAKGIAPTVRVERVVCSPTAPSTVATRADLRRGWRWEAVAGLPDEYRGPAKVADGAIRFATLHTAAAIVAPDEVVKDADGGFYLGSSSAGTTARTTPSDNYEG